MMIQNYRYNDTPTIPARPVDPQYNATRDIDHALRTALPPRSQPERLRLLRAAAVLGAQADLPLMDCFDLIWRTAREWPLVRATESREEREDNLRYSVFAALRDAYNTEDN